jgi:hypothetical protein
VTDAHARELYGADFAHIRPDQHVSWRGTTPPSNADTILASETGA